jgi:hypothetical protein
MIGYDPDHNGGRDGGMWVYDVLGGIWKFLAMPNYVNFRNGITLDGESIAVTQCDSIGNFYSSIYDIWSRDFEFGQHYTMPDIWQNWVVMYEYAYFPKLKIYNYQNDWHEYEIDLPKLTYRYGVIMQLYAIYEPPPDGIDGMYCNP